MNLRQLEYFLKVVEMGSITRAASALRMTQPALSRQVRVFEDEMGWKLFERGAKSIQLTHAGEVVAREGKKILGAVDAGMMQMKREVDGGIIRVGYAPSLGGEILKIAMNRFIQLHPKVNIQLFDSSSEEMRTWILDGKLDLMVEVKREDSRFGWLELNKQCFSLALPLVHPILEGKKKKVVDAEELEGQRFLLLSRYEYPNYWKEVAGYFKSCGVNVKVAGEFDGIESMSVAIEAGLGIALVSASSRMPDSVAIVKLNPDPKPVRVAVGWDETRPRDPAVLAFIEELRLAAMS